MPMRVPLPLYHRLAAVAVRRHIPLNTVVCEALTDWCDRNAPLTQERDT